MSLEQSFSSVRYVHMTDNLNPKDVLDLLVDACIIAAIVEDPVGDLPPEKFEFIMSWSVHEGVPNKFPSEEVSKQIATVL